MVRVEADEKGDKCSASQIFAFVSEHHLTRLFIGRALGCILYEVYYGKPPFYTNNVFHLIKMIGKGDTFFSNASICSNKSILESVKWPQPISPDLRNFLEGLLTKDSSLRLTWPELAQHPFVRAGIRGTPVA